MMRNTTQTPKQENSKFLRTLDEMHTSYRKMMHDLNESYQDLMEGKGDPEKIEQISKHVRTLGDMIQGMNILIKRDRIERQGYDTNAAIAARDDKEAREAKKNAEMEAKQQSENSKQDVHPDLEQEKQPDENEPELTHLHPNIEECHDNLPVQDKPKEIARNIRVVEPTSIISLKGQMCSKTQPSHAVGQRLCDPP